MTPRWKKELALALGLVCFGLFLLPLAIYAVGAEIIGPYDGEGGAFALAFDVWSALVRPSLTAWVLVLSPYLVVQLVRLALRILRPQAVNAVTD